MYIIIERIRLAKNDPSFLNRLLLGPSEQPPAEFPPCDAILAKIADSKSYRTDVLYAPSPLFIWSTSIIARWSAIQLDNKMYSNLFDTH